MSPDNLPAAPVDARDCAPWVTPDVCCVCGESPARIHPLANRTHPLCAGCAVRWYEGGPRSVEMHPKYIAALDAADVAAGLRHA